MAKRLTKEIRYISLPEKRIEEIRRLVASWPYETKAFMRSRLNQYSPPSDWLNTLLENVLSFFLTAPERRFEILKDPEILTDWQRRFEISGKTNPQQAWNKILEKEVSAKDYTYLLSLLDKDLGDVHVPVELTSLFEKIYRAHIRKEYLSDPSIPKAPLILFIGPSGSGKTSTVRQTLEQVIFVNEVRPEVDLKQKKEEALAGETFWKTIDQVDPSLAAEIAARKKVAFYQFLARMPGISRLLKNRIGKNLSQFEEQGILVDYSMVTPNDYQTALAGEPGNYFKKALGDPRKTTIRHVEEAHSAFGKTEGKDSGPDRQQRTLIDTANIVIDEIINGQRDCLLIATTDQPERFDQTIYRRFVEKGKILDLSDFWKNPENLKEVVCLELLRNDIVVTDMPDDVCLHHARCISPSQVQTAVDGIYAIFQERSLKITPAYVRKLVHSIIEIQGGFSSDYLKDSVLVRKAFKLVARNAFGDLFEKVVDRMDRNVHWDDYVGKIKDVFSEMANNCLYYNVSEEKGVVLNGPPGSGKTFLIRAWLSENSDIHDIATSPSALQDPINPWEGAVENLEKVYDIAKMIAPSLVFFDEGDSLAPKRSASGGSPSDKLTNKFLNLIDGEIPLNQVFTVLTTNRLDILDPALIRSKRLKVMEISGHLRRKDITDIVRQTLKDIPLARNLSVEAIVELAKGLCNTPADYSAFVEKARSLRSTEYEVLQRIRDLAHASPAIRDKFVKFNFKTLMGILEALDAPQSLRSTVYGDPAAFLSRYGDIVALLEPVGSFAGYPLMVSHLNSARQEISHSPVKIGKMQLDEFLEAELSQEPQVGFIIGVGANDVSGVLLPIATSLTYSLSAEKVLVTGAVSSGSSATAELDMAVQMTQQSAQEALTLVKNYLQELDPKVSIPKLLGEFLDRYTIHHQLLSASYNVGGPSAGYALALNTLSALLQIPIYHDFGITGAPWTKGVKKGEVGGSVIIGGHKKKTEKVLQYLRRMYMPLQNYKDLENEFLVNYWEQGKDVLGISNFGELVPEVVCLGAGYEATLKELIAVRIDDKLKKSRGHIANDNYQETIQKNRKILKDQLENQIVSRLEAIRKYLRNPVRDPHQSLEEIFLEQGKSRLIGIPSILNFLSNRKKWIDKRPFRGRKSE
jgi:transitional endoplasmic reticulum ATPase